MDNNEAIQNALLFVAVLRGDELRIKKHLALGADVNAKDLYDNANTPLHVAVLKGEPKIVEFLLENGANMFENSEGKYPLDLAMQDIPNAEKIVKILKARDNKKSININEDNIEEQVSRKPEISTFEVTKADADVKRYCFEKDSTTSSIEGQFYETKLLSLILYRACNYAQIQNFFMASNIKGLTPFDDIIFKFNSTEDQKPRIVFIQAKHRINPEKNTFTVTDVLNENNHDFYLYRYFKIYADIKQKFNSKQSIATDNPIFKYPFKDVDSYFIIYTPSIDNFEKKNYETVIDKNVNDLIKTSEIGKIFQLHDDDKKRFVTILHQERAIIPLVKRLANFFNGAEKKYSYDKMMRDDLIRQYHIALANEVFQIEMHITVEDNATKTSEITDDSKVDIQNLKEVESNDAKTEKKNNFKTKKETYRKSKFRKEFLGNNNVNNLSILREVLFKELQLQPTDNPEFKLPVEFGNVDINTCKIDKIIKKVSELLDKADKNGAALTLRPDKLTNEMMNNVLVLKAGDNVIEFAKDINLAQNAKKVFENFNNKDLSKYNFKFDQNKFPRFSINALQTELQSDNNEANEFCSKLWYYSGQDQQHEIEKKMISYLDVKCKSHKLNDEVPLEISSASLFLEYHEKVLKWWISKEKEVDYLTKTCTFFDEAVKHVEGNPLTFILSSIYVKDNRIDNIKFKHQAIKHLELNKFIYNTNLKKLLRISTDDNVLSAAKLFQYFEQEKLNFIFLDLKWMTGPYADIIMSDLNQPNIYNLVIVWEKLKDRLLPAEKKKKEEEEELKDQEKLRELIKRIINAANDVKVIILTDNCSVAKQDYSEIIIEKRDDCISLTDICDDLQSQILDRNVIFQGALVKVRNVLNEDLKCHLKANILRELIRGSVLEVGNILTDNKYDDTRKRCYISRKLIRCIKIKDEFKENEYTLNEEKLKTCNLIVYNGQSSDVLGDHMNNDLIVICNSNDHLSFLESIMNNTILNLHYFQKIGTDFIWIKSVGNLTYLHNCIESIPENKMQSLEEHTYELKSLTDINEKMILIAAGPGMGKSTLLTHLSLETNNSSPEFWIVRVNLQYHSREFKNLRFEINENIVLQILRRITIQCKTKSGKAMENKEIETLDMDFFDNYYQKEKLVVLCDGFNEMIPNYEKQVIAFLLMLKKTKIKHIWVTTRPQIQQTLERALDLFPYELMHLDDEDLTDYLDSVNIPMPNDEFLYDTEFLRTPLHLYMYAEVILDEIKKRVETMNKIPLFVFKIPDKYTLFEKFIKMKIESRPEFEDDYFGSINRIDTISAMNILDGSHSKFLKDHQIMAVHAICTELLPEQDLRKQEHDLRERIDRTLNDKSSLIEIIHGSVRFVHFTFAEYFFSEFLCDLLVSESFDKVKLWDFLINKFFVHDKYAYARGFINVKFRTVKELAKLWSKSEHAENVYDILMKHVNDRKEQADNEKRLIFDVCLDENLHNILIFLLNCNKINHGGYTYLLNLTQNTYNTCHSNETMNNFFIGFKIEEFVQQLRGIEAPNATTPDLGFENLLTAKAPIEEIFKIAKENWKEIFCMALLGDINPAKREVLRWIHTVSFAICPSTGEYISIHSANVEHEGFVLRRRDSARNYVEKRKDVNRTRRKSYPTTTYDYGQLLSYKNDVRSRLQSLF